MPAGFDCLSFNDPVTGGDPGIPGWGVEECYQAPSYAGQMIVLKLYRRDDGRPGVAVLFPVGDHFEQRYFAQFEPDVLDAISIFLEDLNGDDGVEAWIGYKYQGTGKYLDFEVLDPRPDGSFFLGGVHSIDHGRVDLHPGGATVRLPLYQLGDPNCCPSLVLHRIVAFDGTNWLINEGFEYFPATEPPLTLDI